MSDGIAPNHPPQLVLVADRRNDPFSQALADCPAVLGAARRFAAAAEDHDAAGVA